MQINHNIFYVVLYYGTLMYMYSTLFSMNHKPQTWWLLNGSPVFIAMRKGNIFQAVLFFLAISIILETVI